MRRHVLLLCARSAIVALPPCYAADVIFGAMMLPMFDVTAGATPRLPADAAFAVYACCCCYDTRAATRMSAVDMLAAPHAAFDIDATAVSSPPLRRYVITLRYADIHVDMLCALRNCRHAHYAPRWHGATLMLTPCYSAPPARHCRQDGRAFMPCRRWRAP